jgi:DNA-binding NtrC family response regulator
VRERHDDIALLVDSILERIRDARHARVGRNGGAISVAPSARVLLAAYPWPGNIRELRNVLERACLLTDDGVIRAEHLSDEIRAAQTNTTSTHSASPTPLRTPCSDDELAAFAAAFDGTRKQLAEQLGLSERTLYRRIANASVTPPRSGS